MSRGYCGSVSAGSTILERVAVGESSATRECLACYGNLVWGMARRYLRNPADAEDAVQDIFIDVWRSAARYDSSLASETTFIATIARRRIIDRMRLSGRRPFTESLDDEEVGFAEPCIQATSEQDAEVALVGRVIATLDPRHQQVLALSLMQGFSHQEIGDLLGMPVGTVKSWVRRGLIRVRAELQIPAASATVEASTG